MSKYTFNDNYQAHNMSRTETVVVPDQVACDQHAFDGKTFPIIKRNGNQGRGRLIGDEYGLCTPGTGDMIVKIER